MTEYKQNASLGFLRKKPADKTGFGKNVTDALTAANTPKPPVFDTLPYPIPVLIATNDTLIAAVGAALLGGLHDKQVRDAAQEVWNLQFEATALEVSRVANGNPVIITLGGFIPTKGTGTENQPPTQAMLKYTKVATSSIQVSLLDGCNADAYLYMALPPGTVVTPNGDGSMTIEAPGAGLITIKCDTHHTTTLSSLESQHPVVVMVQPVNNAGAGPASDPKTVTPQ